MSAKTATIRLYVAVVTLVTTLVALVAALLHLAVVGLSWLAARVERGGRPEASQKPATAPARALRLVPPPPASVPVGGPPGAAERLTSALVGLGFKVPDVRKVVASLGDRVQKESIEALIKVGLAALTTAA